MASKVQQKPGNVVKKYMIAFMATNKQKLIRQIGSK
jgi:hypothetical protein